MRLALAEFGRRGIFRERWAHGPEGGLSCLVVLAEETVVCSSSLAVAVMGHSEVFTGALYWLASAAAQRELLEAALAGRAIGCFAATEPHGGSDLTGISMTAVPTDAGWRLQGCKRYVSNLDGASHILVLARESAREAGDLSLFWLPLDARGVVIDGFFDMIGMAGCGVGQLSLDVALPPEALLGQSGLGLLYATRLLTFERVSICAQLLASADLALRLAAAYARNRTAGGSRLMDRQVIRHRLARCQAELWQHQSQLREMVTAAERHMPARQIAALKLTTAEAVERILDTCLQVFGARGATSALPVARFWQDSRLARLGGGPDEILAELVAADLDRPDVEAERLLASYLASDSPRPSTEPKAGTEDA
jgi:alkylation response protein AidB-like acyl-CoA dehydrogenase